ncbi:MAG: ABC transporter substrate-binding protein [Desulfohalobiaceae bacterium]|nr:ABC transporter substrate-binding protein [Desulfohalobiaceae bacterium]
MVWRMMCMAGLIWCLLPSGAVAGEAPAERIDTYIDKVLQVFQGADSCTGDCDVKSELRKRLSGLSTEIFDFRIMSMMSLGRHWKKLSGSQQDTFIDLYRQLLEANYFEKIVKHFQKIQEYSKEKVEILDETLFSSRKAEVESVIRHDGETIPVDYRLVLQDEQWKIYDVLVEGVSLIGNYRKQFDEILFEKSPEAMLEALREKVENDPSSLEPEEFLESEDKASNS